MYRRGDLSDMVVSCYFLHVLATITGSSLLGALGEVRDGEYRDSLAASGDGTYLASYDRGGTYAVHIDRRRLLHG